MARNRQSLNIIYISDRMRETLRPIASCALTAVVAPMGYGKTTAVRWFLAEQAKAGAVVLQASIYSDNRSIFWKSVQKAFAAAGLTVLEGYDCPADASGAALLLEDLCAALGGKTPYYLFLDDFHLLGDERVAQFLCRLPTACRERPPYRGQPQPLSARGAGGAAGAAAPPHRGRWPPPEPGGAAGLHPPLRCGDHRRPGREPAALLRGVVLRRLPEPPCPGRAGEPAAAGVGHLRHVHRRHAGVSAREDPGLPRRDGAGR